MLIDGLIETIRKKYNYDDELVEILKQILPAMIEYFGEENSMKVLYAFQNTPIALIDAINVEEGKKELAHFVKSIGVIGDYRLNIIASGCHEEKIQINKDGNVEVIPFVLIRKGKMDDLEYFNTIVHEMCHAVMNQDKFRIEDDKITSSTGFIQDSIEFVDGEAKTTSKNVQIEEGFNEYDARQITQRITGKYPQGSYGLSVSYVAPLMNNLEIRKIINQSRLDGNDDWMQILGVEESLRFINLLDDFHKTLFSFSLDEEEQKRLIEEKRNALKEMVDSLTEFASSYSSNNRSR